MWPHGWMSRVGAPDGLWGLVQESCLPLGNAVTCLETHSWVWGRLRSPVAPLPRTHGSQMTNPTLWTVARQAPLSVGFSRQEYWSGLPFPSPI